MHASPSTASLRCSGIEKRSPYPWTVHGGYSPGGLQSIESQALDMTEATEHAHTSVCMSILISQFVPLSPPTPLSTCPFSMSVSLFLSCK